MPSTSIPPLLRFPPKGQTVHKDSKTSRRKETEKRKKKKKNKARKKGNRTSVGRHAGRDERRFKRKRDGNAPTQDEDNVSLRTALKRIKQQRVRAMNDELTIFANRKQLDKATSLFRDMERRRVENEHTYAIMMNVLVRCGQTKRASELLTKMMGEKKMKPGVVCFTSLLKGYCDAEYVQRDPTLRRSMALIAKMTGAVPPVLPNIRTCNTLLRGCLWVGAVERAEDVMVRMREEWNVRPDESSWEYLVALLCQGLKVKQATKLVCSVTRSMRPNSSAALAMWVNVAQAWVLLGHNMDMARKAIRNVQKGLNEDDVDDRSTRLTGGKRGWHRDAKTKRVNGIEDGRAQSAVLFNIHRMERLRQRTESIKAFVDKISSDDDGVRPTTLTTNPWQLGQVLSFWSDERRKKTSSLAERFVQSLVTRFGLKTLLSRCRKLHQSDVTPRSYVSFFDDVVVTKEDEESTEFVDFPKLFASIASKGSNARMIESKSDPPPVHMELGCGSGEWCTSQALASEDTLWVALELRHSRVYEVFTRIVYEGAHNMCVVGGDAIEVLRHNVAPRSITHFFVNHPEPPKQVGNMSYEDAVEELEGRHLLGMTCFRLMHAALRTQDGAVTIVTDNLWYGTFLLHVVDRLASSKTLFRSPDVSSSTAHVQTTHRGVRLWVGTPGEVCGHQVAASSYFDRLWKKGISRHASSSERYFLFLRL